MFAFCRNIIVGMGVYPMDLRQIVLQFNDHINEQDINGLASLMTDDHTFIDAEGNAINGKENCINAWRGFFNQFPDYKNTLITITSRDDSVAVTGYSTSSNALLNGPAIWIAKLRDGKLIEWRVYADTIANRQQLNIPLDS
jgi:ketosteroid isomerase-like protein